MGAIGPCLNSEILPKAVLRARGTELLKTILGLPKGRCMGSLGEGDPGGRWALPWPAASAQASCAACDSYLTERHCTAPGPSCTLIKH